MNTYKIEQLAIRYKWWLIAFLLLACMFDGYYPECAGPEDECIYDADKYVCYTDVECVELNGPGEGGTSP
jgi:hypothetical protein